MTGPDEKDPLFGDDDLDGLLDDWDKMFDELHEEVQPGGGAAEAAPVEAAPVEPAPSEPSAPVELGYDDDLEVEVEIGPAPGAAPVESASPEPRPSPADVLGDDLAIEFDIEPTALGTLLGRDEGSGAAPMPSGAPRTTRSPALISREDLERRRREREEALEKLDELEPELDFSTGPSDHELDLDDDAASDWDAPSVTSVMAKSAVDKMVETAAAFFEEDDEPEIQLELDGDFYDDIEIDAEATSAPAPAAPAAIVSEGSQSHRRATTAHIIRRAPSIAQAEPAPLQTTEDSVVVEIEADHEELELLGDPGTSPRFDDALLSEALAGQGESGPFSPDVDLPQEAARALASQAPDGLRIDSIDKLREALELGQQPVSGELDTSVPAEGARALEQDGELAPISLPEVALPPELPPRVLTRPIPGLEAVELALPEVATDERPDRTDEQVLRLEQARTAIEQQGPGVARARLHLWAAEIAAELGDLDEVERHAAEALDDDPELAGSVAALRRRRLARLGDWDALATSLAEAAEAAGDHPEAAALGEVAAEIGAALGHPPGPRDGDADDLDINQRWRSVLDALAKAPDDLDGAIPALAASIADAPMREVLARIWLRRRGAEVWDAASQIAPSLAGDLIAWELAGARGPSARAAAARQIADALEAESQAPALVDTLRIAAGEAYRATGDTDSTREILTAVAERQSAHPILSRMLLAVLGPEDRETAGYLLAAVSGTALAPEAARALRRWAESDTGAVRMERLRRAQALSPGDPLVRADLAAAEREIDPATTDDTLVSVRLALAPRVSGDPVALLNRAREMVKSGDVDDALAELASDELPRSELLVAAEILDAADAAGPAAAVNAWASIAEQAGDTARPLLRRRIALSEIDRAVAERDESEGGVLDLGAALAALAELAPTDAIAARAVVAEALSVGPRALADLGDDVDGWPGLDRTQITLERIGLDIGGDQLTESLAGDVLVATDELDDPRIEWLSIVALGRSGDWQRAADRIAAAGGVAAGYRAAYLQLEWADDPGAADTRLVELADAHPDLAPLADLLDAARRKLGVGAEIARPTRARRRSADPWTGTIIGAELAFRSGELHKAIEIYKRALKERPDDPIALEGLEWTARTAIDANPLAERALAALRAAEEDSDISARADAYATLARIDSEIRGDPASALLAWESCAGLDPSHPEALRALERAYLTGNRHRELLMLYGRLLAGAETDAELAALLLLRARSATQVGRDIGEVLGDYRQIIDLDGVGDRMALFHLESAGHGGDPSPERAELEEQVSRLLLNDPRSAAAFMCRAGETLASIGDHQRASDRFARALEIREGHVPSLRGWRRVALASEDWAALARATEAEAATAGGDDRVALLHLAGVIWMDRVSNGDEARRVFSAVLALAPHHEDAFARQRLLHDEVGDDEALGDLLRQLLESSPPADVALAAHLELASLCRNFWEDREGAVEHLKAVLALAPGNKKAIAELSDINWELGRWDDAADTLIRRAKLETDDNVLKHIFYRLGTIYADHLPDPKWALRCFRKVLSLDPDDVPTLDRMGMLATDGGDTKMALAAYERLLKLEITPEEKVGYLHRIADIQERTLGQPAAAERALRVAFDLAPHSVSALRRLVDFYQRAGDMTSIRVNLDRAAQAMRARLVSEPLDPTPYVVIARVLKTREAAGVPGSLVVAQSAAELAASLGDQSAETSEIAASRVPGRPRLEAFAAPEVDDLLIPRVVPAGLRVVFSALRSRLPKYVGADVKRFGVGRGDRLRKGKHPVANLAHEMADELGLRSVEVYISSAVTDKAMVVPTSPPSVILGSRFSSLDRGAELAFALGRCLKLAQMGLAMIDTMNPTELDKLVGGIVRQFAPDFLAFNLEDEALAAEQHRLRRLIPGGLSSELRPHALALTGVLLEPETLHASLRLCGLRAGLVASGNAAAALAAGLRHSGYSTSREAMADPDIRGLLRFAVSEEHVEIQSLLAAN